MEVIPIAQLSSVPLAVETKSIRAIVTLLWPYSASTQKISLLLAEPDFRLRAKKGQIKVHFRGASARSVANCHVGIGDEVVLGLGGATWIEPTRDVSTPGRSVDSELVYGGLLDLQVSRDGASLATIELDGAADIGASEPASPDLSHTSFDTPAQLRSRKSYTSSGLHTPLFHKRTRVSSGSLVDSPIDPFSETSYEIDDRERKRPRYSWGGTPKWKVVGREPSPTKADAMDVDNWIRDEEESTQAAEQRIDDAKIMIATEQDQSDALKHFPIVSEAATTPESGHATPSVSGSIMAPAPSPPSISPAIRPSSPVPPVEYSRETTQEVDDELYRDATPPRSRAGQGTEKHVHFRSRESSVIEPTVVQDASKSPDSIISPVVESPGESEESDDRMEPADEDEYDVEEVFDEIEETVVIETPSEPERPQMAPPALPALRTSGPDIESKSSFLMAPPSALPGSPKTPDLQPLHSASLPLPSPFPGENLSNPYAAAFDRIQPSPLDFSTPTKTSPAGIVPDWMFQFGFGADEEQADDDKITVETGDGGLTEQSDHDVGTDALKPAPVSHIDFASNDSELVKSPAMLGSSAGPVSPSPFLHPESHPEMLVGDALAPSPSPIRSSPPSIPVASLERLVEAERPATDLPTMEDSSGDLVDVITTQHRVDPEATDDKSSMVADSAIFADLERLVQGEEIIKSQEVIPIETVSRESSSPQPLEQKEPEVIELLDDTSEDDSDESDDEAEQQHLTSATGNMTSSQTHPRTQEDVSNTESASDGEEDIDVVDEVMSDGYLDEDQEMEDDDQASGGLSVDDGHTPPGVDRSRPAADGEGMSSDDYSDEDKEMTEVPVRSSPPAVPAPESYFADGSMPYPDLSVEISAPEFLNELAPLQDIASASLDYAVSRPAVPQSIVSQSAVLPIPSSPADFLRIPNLLSPTTPRFEERSRAELSHGQTDNVPELSNDADAVDPFLAESPAHSRQRLIIDDLIQHDTEDMRVETQVEEIEETLTSSKYAQPSEASGLQQPTEVEARSEDSVIPPSTPPSRVSIPQMDGPSSGGFDGLHSDFEVPPAASSEKQSFLVPIIETDAMDTTGLRDADEPMLEREDMLRSEEEENVVMEPSQDESYKEVTYPVLPVMSPRVAGDLDDRPSDATQAKDEDSIICPPGPAALDNIEAILTDRPPSLEVTQPGFSVEAEHTFHELAAIEEQEVEEPSVGSVSPSGLDHANVSEHVLPQSDGHRQTSLVSGISDTPRDYTQTAVSHQHIETEVPITPQMSQHMEHTHVDDVPETIEQENEHLPTPQETQSFQNSFSATNGSETTFLPTQVSTDAEDQVETITDKELTLLPVEEELDRRVERQLLDEVERSPEAGPRRRSLFDRAKDTTANLRTWFSPRQQERKKMSTRSHQQAVHQQSNGDKQHEVSPEMEEVKEAPKVAIPPAESVQPAAEENFESRVEAHTKRVAAFKEDTATYGFRTKISYYTPISCLPSHVNASSPRDAVVDILAVVVGKSTQPKKADKGPKHYYTTLRITDTSVEGDSVIKAQCFRPNKVALPTAQPGDVVLLRGFEVLSVKDKGLGVSLRSTEESAWCVWHFAGKNPVGDATENGALQKGKPVWAQKSSNKAGQAASADLEDIKGPPIELGQEERDKALTLAGWWAAKTADDEEKEEGPEKQGGGLLHSEVDQGVQVHEGVRTRGMSKHRP